MPLHVLWTHSMHCENRMEFLLTPLQKTAQGYLPDFWRTSWSSPETRNVIFFRWTWSPSLSMPAFHTLNLEIHSSWMSTMSTRSSVLGSSHSIPVQNSCNSSDSTRMKTSELRAEPKCAPTVASLFRDWPASRFPRGDSSRFALLAWIFS